jgi:hypothetical protein
MNRDDWCPPFSNTQPAPRDLNAHPLSIEEREAERLAAEARVAKKRSARKLLRKHGLGDVEVR